MIRFIISLFVLLGLLSCKDKLDKPPSSGTASVLLNQEQWESEVVLISRDRSVGWDNIILTEYWSDNSVKAQCEIVVDFDLIMDQSAHSFTANIIPLPSIELDSIISVFGYNYSDGDVTAASYQVVYPTDLSNEISFEIDNNDPRMITATWSVEMHIRDNFVDRAEAEGHPSTIRMENGTATFRLPD